MSFLHDPLSSYYRTTTIRTCLWFFGIGTLLFILKMGHTWGILFPEFGWTLQWTGWQSAPNCWWSTTRTSWRTLPSSWGSFTTFLNFRSTKNGSSASVTIRTTNGNVRRRRPDWRTIHSHRMTFTGSLIWRSSRFKMFSEPEDFVWFLSTNTRTPELHRN